MMETTTEEEGSEDEDEEEEIEASEPEVSCVLKYFELKYSYFRTWTV